MIYEEESTKFIAENDILDTRSYRKELESKKGILEYSKESSDLFEGFSKVSSKPIVPYKLFLYIY